MVTLLKDLKTNVISQIQRITQPVTEFIRGNPIASGVAGGVGASVVAVGLAKGLSTVVKRKKTRTKTRKTSKKRRKVKRRRKTRRVRRGKGRRTPYTAGKGKDRSTKRIRYTKKGQPYVITRSGKAKFIKKTSARRSHKLKGGRY